MIFLQIKPTRIFCLIRFRLLYSKTKNLFNIIIYIILNIEKKLGVLRFSRNHRNLLVGNVFCWIIKPQAVRRDSEVPFSLSNFLENILQPTTSEMSPTSNLGL